MKCFFTSEKLRAVYTGILADLMVTPSEFPALGVPLFNLESAFDARNPQGGERPGPRSVYRYIRNGCRNLVRAARDALVQARDQGAGVLLISEDLAFLRIIG